MARRRAPPSQGWKTFLRNHADGIAAMDPFVVPTVSFRLLYGLLIIKHSRRKILWLGVTAHPTAEWLANQRECVDHLNLRRILRDYAAYYNGSRTHRALNHDSPIHRMFQTIGTVNSRLVLGGLQHRYCRIWVFRHTQDSCRETLSWCRRTRTSACNDTCCHSGLIPACFTTVLQRADSSRMKASKSSGVPLCTSAP